MTALTWRHADGAICESGVTMQDRDHYRCTEHNLTVQYDGQDGGDFAAQKSSGVGDVLKEAYREQLAFQKQRPIGVDEQRERELDAECELGVDADSDARLMQVGWYCAGDHERESRRQPGKMVKVKGSSLLKQDEPQCEHAVPVFVLAKGESVVRWVKPAPIDYSSDHPAPDFVRSLLDQRVQITTHSGSVHEGQLGGIINIDGDEDDIVSVLIGVGARELTLDWADIKTCEPA